MVLDKNNSIYFRNVLDNLKNEHLYRQLKILNEVSLPRSRGPGSNICNFSSNDYLGLSRNKILIEKLRNLSLNTISQCSSRLISGNTSKLEELEALLSNHRNSEDSLVYPTGYMANLGVISCIADKSTEIFSDALNHASIIDACKLSDAKTHVFSHNNTIELEQKVSSSKKNKKIIITEGIFSMNGDFAKLTEISKIAEKYGCLLVVDDAHGDFVVGNKELKNYSGTPSFFNVDKNVDIHISSLSKGLGCFGGYVSCSKLIREFLINKSRSFIFTSALPDFLCELANSSIALAKQGTQQEKLENNIKYFQNLAREYDIPGLAKSIHTPIIPVVIGSERKTITISRKLQTRGFYVQGIRYPTVKKNEGQLRVSLTALHTSDQISDLIVNIAQVLKR